MATKKEKLASTGAAIALAAMLLIGGGTFAYLQSTTDDVVNEFATNQVKVELKETTGNNYNIVPGTEQEKNPKVTVTNSVDSYVYVEVTDTTDGLVGYEIADGWIPLGNGYDNVYYREVAKNADPKVFSVLKGDKVTYDAALENSNMVNSDGTLKDGIKLTFKASAVQKEGFESAEEAFAFSQYPNAKNVSTTDELTAAIKEGKAPVLTEDINPTEALNITNGTIVGNGNAITGGQMGGNARIINLTTGNNGDASLTLDNVDMVGETEQYNSKGISAYEADSINLNVKGSSIEAKAYAIRIGSGVTNGATLNVQDSELKGWAALDTQAKTTGTFNNVTFTGTNGILSGPSNSYNLITVQKGGEGSVLTFNNCTFDLTKSGEADYYFFGVNASTAESNVTFICNNCTFIYNGKTLAYSEVPNYTCNIKDTNKLIIK